MFRAEDTTRANYRSLFEYAAGVEARLAQDRRLAYYHKVLPELLHRVKGLPLMYTTYSKGWNPDSNREAFIVKRRVPDLSKPLYIEDDEGNTIQKGYTTQDFVIEGDEDVNDFMIRKNRFKGQHGFNKGFGYLAPVYHVERDEMPFIQVDLDIDQADFKKPAWNKLLQAVTKVYDWFRSEGFDPLINFTGSSFHIWAKDGKVRSYAEIKEILTQLSKDTKLPLAAGAAHIVNQITIDYPQNKYRAPMRFPLSIHGDTGLASIIIPRNQLLKFDPLKKAHPDQVLKQLPNHLAKIDAWFDDLPTSKQSAEDIITSHLATLDEADIERCMWGDCGVLADELMAKLQAAGYTDAVYEIGRAYIHPFEEYDDKTFIGGHVVVTVDGVSYDALGAGAKQRWKDSSVLVDILSQHGYDELGPLLSAHLTIDWITSTWDEVQETRRHNFAGKLVDFESEEMSKTWYSSGNVHPWQLFLDTETLGPDLFGERDNYPYEDMKALESKYGLSPISAVIWVSALPEVAASYMIGQGLIHNSDESVKEDYGFSKSELETTKFGQIYYPPHVEHVWQYQGTVIPETDDGDGGYLLALNRDYTGRYGLKRIGKSAETEYKKKRKKPTPEPGVEGSGKLKPTRRKPPMKVKGSDVYSVQKHRATKRGSHRDIRIGLDGKLLSFVPVGRYEKKDEDGKWQKTDGSRLPKKIGDGVSVIRTEDHPFDYWWFEGEIPKDSYGAGPVSLETYGTRRIIEWKPNKKLKVEFIGGKYAGTYTFERSKKSKDGKVWWMRKSRPVPKDKKDKKTKKAEISDEGYCSECGEHWMDIRTQEGKGLKFDDGPWEECWNCYTQFENFNEDEFDYYTHMFTQDVVEGQTVKKYVDSIHDGYFSWSDALDDLEFTLQKVPLSVWDNIERSEVDGQWIDAPVYSHRLSNTLLQFRNQHPDDDYPPVVLKLDESGNYEVIDGFHRLNALQILGRDSVRAWVGTPVVNRKTKKAEEKWYGPPALEAVMNEDVRDQYGYSMFSKALTEWSEKFLAGERNAKEMVERAYYEDGAGPGDGLIVDYDPSNGIVDIESGVSSHYGLSASEAIERFARRYVEELLISAKYYRGRIKLYRGIQLVNPEDFDPTEVGQSWTPIKTAAKPYFGFQRYYSRNLERIYSRTADSETYVLTALVPVESINWYYTLMRALAFGLSDEKEIVLKGGATIELIDIPLDLSFAIDATPEALIRAAEEDEGDKAKFEGKYLAKVAEYESSNKWREDVKAMDVMGDETYIYALEGRLEYMFPELEHPLSQAKYDELKLANPKLVAEEELIARSISDDMLYRVYEMLFGSGGDFYGAAEYYNGKILLYREITMNRPEDLNTARAGIFWTPALEAAEAHWSGAPSGDYFILRALVDFDDINWVSSWYANLIMPEECEIRLKQGAKIELLPLTRAKTGYGRNLMLGGYVYPEEIVYEIDAPNPNLLAVERGTETELLEAMKDLPEEYQRLMGISEVEPQPTQTAFASEEDEVVLYHGTAAANIESILQEGLMPTGGWSVDSNQTGVFLTPHPDGATSWARWSAMKAIEPESKGASVGETRKFYSMMARLRMQESDAVAILEVRIPKDCYQDLYCDVADLIDSGIIIGDSYEDLDVSQWDACMQNGIDLVFEGGAIPPEWISVLPWQEDWVDSYWSSVIADMISEHGEDYFGAEDIDLTVGEAFDKALAEIRADVDSVQPHSKDLSDVTFEDYNMAKAVYQSFIVPAGITGSIVRDEWYYESEPIYLWSDIFTLPEGSAGEEWKQKIDAQKTEKESDILASNEINYAFYWYAIMQINSIYSMLLSRLVQKFGNVPGGVYAGPPVELPKIIESQRDSTDIEIYRWLTTSQDERPVRRLRNRMRPVDLNYYGGYSLDYLDGFGGVESVQEMMKKGLEALSYGPCWSLSPDAYTRTDQWILAQEEQKIGKAGESDEEISTYVIEKSIPASGVDWYSTLISSALWLDSPEYEVIPKRGVFLSEEITDSSDFEQEFNKVVAEVTNLFKEFSWFSNNQKELYDVSNLHNDEAGRARLRDVESHLSKLTRPGSLLWSSGDDSAYDAYPDDLRNPEYIFQDSGIFVDENGETDGFTDEERGETYEEGHYFTRPFEESPDLDIRLRYAYTLNRLSKIAEQYFSRLKSLRTTLEPQFASGEVTLYRAFSLPEGEVPQLRRMTVFPLSMRIGDARRMENKEQRVKYNYESYGAHWSFLPGFEWSDDFPSHYGKPYIMEKQIPYTDIDWFTTLLVMAYGREPEWEVAVNENVFLAENEVKIPLYHVTPLDQVSNILETGLESRIGPRSERMELEPRVYLFGERESMQDSFIWEEMTDERYGDEWLSGYAILRIDLPAEWFTERRVVKTFDPDGPDPSWEWSTREAIPPEYVEVEEEWEWSEDDISRYFQAPDFKELEYPLRLYHGTSVHNWQAIQATGELRTGCLASSEGYDIDMPSTYIDLAIDEIEDDHPDVNDGGVVLKITFPSKAIADQYLEADNTMYDLGMAVLEDDLYSRYAPADWKPEDAEEGWHYGPMNWFITDFQDLVKSNQATKTIPYSPQDRSDWQASYLSVYSVCIKQPIPMEYITVDWGSESMGAESEDMKLETVSESWSQAVKQWKEIVDWAQQHGIRAHREDVLAITPEEFEQAIEIYNKLITVAGIVEISYPFCDMDKDAKSLIPEITTDSKVAEIFRSQLDSIWDGFVDGIYMESMNHYVYYWILDWIKKLNTGLSAGVWRGQELNNIIHTQGRRTAIKAYRWITLPKGQLPTRNPQPLTYGQHWSLHPNAFKETDDWFGMSYGQQAYLIEKEVPVEDIDWFRTLISCLFFKDAEFEIIMNPMTYIAETIDSEEEPSETVGEAWDKAVTDWNLLAEWALYELDQVEKGREIKQVTKKDYQQALDIYKIIDKYSGFMFRDIGMWPEELPGLIPSITDDLESKKLLERQSLDLFDIEGKMNYYFYYALLSWVRGMNWGITGEPGSPIGDYKLNEIILSQFRSPTVKAYRWISTKKDVQPFRRLSRHKYVLSYGDHWSLHPDAYKLTGEWEGVVSSQDYLIEKEVPVEDIDWFATLISCLSWYYNPEFEIIMKPTTYIAETINEPHLYLDMDGCFADFAGAITKRVNEVLQVQDISSIPSKSLRRAARKAKVLGITSVSESDFDLSLSHDPVRKKVIDRMLYKIASEPGFFYNLEVMNRDILEEIVASGRPFSFLSAPIGGTNDYSIEDKRAWVRDRLGLDVAVNVVPREEKITFCYPGDILIDDHATTIAEWSSAGGRGILFPQEIESFLRKPYNGETTTNVAEEVNNVNQYPIMYKKTATGTLQQWQVLLLPQESGGYLLTTASGKVDGAITQGRGKLITEGKVNRTALEQAELEADSKFKKKKDEGYFATKEEAMNNLVVLPMLAHNFEKRSHDIRYPAVAQRKFDGVRCLAITQVDGSVRLMTRKGKDFAHLNHLRDQINALNIEPNMVLDGEVYSDSLTFQEATGLVRRQTLKPGDEDKLSQIDYRLYDAILLDRPEATFLDRYSKLAALFPTSSSVEGRRMGNLVLTENFPLRGPEDIMSLHNQFTGDEEFEGVMIRNLHGTYDLNKRSKHLQKFKTFQDAEYKIVGFNEAGGNWQGTPIWICEMEDGRQFNVTPVGDRPSRIEMFKNVDDYIGKMLTVKFFELTDDGIPRFGNGIAIRDYE